MEIPHNLYCYYQEQPKEFKSVDNKTISYIYYALALFCLALVIYPAIISDEILIRVLGFIAMLVFALLGYAGSTKYFSKANGGEIKELGIKKFDSNQTSDEELLSFLENENFDELAELNFRNNQPLQLYVHQNKEGKEFYLQLMKYFSNSDFRGLSPVKVIREPEYSKYQNAITQIANH